MGRTGCDRLFGKQIHAEVLEFGERVLWRRRSTPDMNLVLHARWRNGIWLWRRWGPGNEFIEARGIMRRPIPERWGREQIELIQCGAATRFL